MYASVTVPHQELPEQLHAPGNDALGQVTIYLGRDMYFSMSPDEADRVAFTLIGAAAAMRSKLAAKQEAEQAAAEAAPAEGLALVDETEA